MKTKWIALALAALGTLTAGFAAERKSKATKDFMRDKLELSQRVLEGIALEDFDLIIAKSKKLSAMSQAANWQVFDNPDYAKHSAEFTRNVEALTRAAENKNLDGVTLAYFRVTMSCVECHRYVKGKMVASRE